MTTLNDIRDHHSILRTLATLVIGVFVSGALVWFMYMLIQSGEKALDESKRVQLLDFVRLKREESSQQKQSKPQRPPITEAPPMPSNPDSSSENSDLSSLGVADMSFNSDLNVDLGEGGGIGDGEYLPIVKVAPIYPLRARTKGLQGSCTVSYTVTTQGTTKGIKVIEDQCPEKIFRKPSIEAAKKFRYKPRVINGEAVEVPEVHNRFNYEMDE